MPETISHGAIHEPQGESRVTAMLRQRSAVAQYTTLIVLVLLTFSLVVLMVSLSLRPTVLIYAHFWDVPWPPTTINYQTAVLDLIPSMVRTLVLTIASIAALLVLACPASYAFARMEVAGKKGLFFGTLAVMMVPGVILLTPHFVLANQLNLRGSLVGLGLFYVAGGLPFAIFLITTFFRAQPVEIFEAARIDGANDIRSLIGIALPLSWPILVTVAIMNFLSIYSDFIWPSLMLPNSQQTLMLALEQYNPQINEFVSYPDIGMQTAGYVFATIPQLILFLFGMKYFIQGVSSGAVKA